jgi:hypothetical protein
VAVDVVEIWDDGNGGGFVKGKRTRKGRPLAPGEAPEPEPVVTLVRSGVLDNFIGARNRAERLAHLRRLREEGVLIHSKGRLQQSLRRDSHGVRRAYVFRVKADEVPRIERQAAPASADRHGGVGAPFAV